ncbi:MAG: helix-turn-helix domain-containing protein [Clostridia bacterium]|nr:helix-turn-helix domain-containing protein [Clostridia bacterium]
MEITFAANLKRFRHTKGYTQKYVAEQLGVTMQTVSRWETGITFPDVMLLPAIAEIYGVMVDDLYKPASVVYENYAQRLASIYEVDRTPENFSKAEREFKKQFQSGNISGDDLRVYGIIHYYMMKYCKETAEKYFNMVISKGVDPNDRNNMYWRTRHQKLLLYVETGRIGESIREQQLTVENGCSEPEEWICLIAAYTYAGMHDEAYQWFLKAVLRFPDYPALYVWGGDCCQELGRFNEAFVYWDKAIKLDPAHWDALYSKAFCYEKLKRFDKAYEVWQNIADMLTQDGYEVEAIFPRKRMEDCRKKQD